MNFIPRPGPTPYCLPRHGLYLARPRHLGQGVVPITTVEKLLGPDPGQGFRVLASPRTGSRTTTRAPYRVNLPAGAREFIEVYVTRGLELAFDHAKLAWRLGEGRTASRLNAGRLPFELQVLTLRTTGIWFEANGSGLQLCPARRPGWSRPTPQKRPAEEPTPPRGRGGEPRRRQRSPRGADSPDGKWTAVIKDHDLYLKDKATVARRLLGPTAPTTIFYLSGGVLPVSHSKKIVVLRTRKGDYRKVFLSDVLEVDRAEPKSSRRTTTSSPATRSRSPADLSDVDTGKAIEVSDALFDTLEQRGGPVVARLVPVHVPL